MTAKLVAAAASLGLAAAVVAAMVAGGYVESEAPYRSHCFPHSSTVLVCQQVKMSYVSLPFAAPPMWWVNR